MVVMKPGEVIRLGWKEGKYPPRSCSVYERMLVDDPRTNNFLEGWHNRFASVVGVAHPEIYKFIKSLKSEQARCENVCLCWSFTTRSTTRSCRAGQLIVALFLGRLRPSKRLTSTKRERPRQ